MASMSVSGVVSGMDWDGMISSVIETAQAPAMVKVNKRTNLTNKKSLFEEMKVTMQSIQSSLTTLKLPSTYKAKDIEIENMGTGSYKKVLTATVNADAEVNVHTLEVKQLATAQTNRSKQITSSTLKSTMGSLESSKMYINIGGQKVGVDVYNTDSLESLKSRINTTLKTLSTPVNVTAAVVDNKLVLKSDTTGLGTTTVEGTLQTKYNSTGSNSLSTIITNAATGATTSICVDDDTAENLKVTSGGSSYTIHKDYEVVNNEIRWKQYEDTEEIKLGDSVGVSYKMAAGDVFKKSVTRGSGDTDSVDLGFTPDDDSLNSGNFKIAVKETTTSEEITDQEPTAETKKSTEDGNEVVTTISYTTGTDDDGETYYTVTTTTTTTKYYTYGTDFTYEDGKIKWLGEPAKTNEPDSYKVSYTQDNSVNETVTATKSIGFSEPSSYTLKYTKNLATISAIKDKTHPDLGNSITFAGFAEIIKDATGESDVTVTGTIQQTNSGSNVKYIKNFDGLYVTGTKDGEETTFEYGRDFILRQNRSNANLGLSWQHTDTTSEFTYVDDYQYVTGENYSTFQVPAQGTTFTVNYDYTYTADNANSSQLTRLLTAAEGDYSGIVITDSEGNEYTYTSDSSQLDDEHFSIDSNGNIVWADVPSVDDDIDIDNLLTSYESSTGSTISTVTLTGSDGIIRTYLDPEDLEYFSITGTLDGQEVTYQYGRDFVLRVDDDGDGYVTSWLVTNDRDKDGLYTAKDANVEVSTYTQYKKNISTLNFLKAPDEGEDYNLNFDYEDIETTTKTVSSSAADKSLKTIFDLDDELDESEYSNITITSTDGKTEYIYGTDFNIEDGKILWNEIATTSPDPVRPSSSTEYEIIYTSTDGEEVLKLDEAVTRSNSDVIALTNGERPDYDEMTSGTVTITQGSKTFYEHYDFEVGENDNGEVTIDWITGTDYEWYYPQPGANSQYTVNLVTADGEEKSYNATRNYIDVLDMRNNGFEIAEGSLTSLTYDGVTYDLTNAADDDDSTTTDVEIVRDTLGLNISDWTNGGKKVYNFNWLTPELTSREGMPSYGSDVEISYDYYANTFTLSDDGDGIIDLLGLNDDVTDAQNAIIVLNDTQIEKDLNDIGADYDNEISNLKGVTLHLKGVGEVSLDIFHDAEKAVESIQTYVDNYNSLMSWINTRMSEKQLDENTAATVDSDDFRMRWGLLHGNSLLRNTKTQMRNISAQNFTYKFTKRTSASEIYGTMANNGLRSSSTFRLRIGSTYSDITIEPDDTLETIAAKINDDTATSQAKNLHYDLNGQKLEQALLTASVEKDRLVITSSSDDQITISGTAAMNALKMNYTYKGIYQLGIGVNANTALGSSSTVDIAKAESGELEFNTEKFMTALEDNPDETQELMLMYANSMDTWIKSMLNSSASGATSGTLTREIENLDSQIKDIDEYLQNYQDRLDRMEESLRTKYAAAEQRISKLSQQASAIASILQQMTNSGGGNNSNSSASA